jgi:hypothetical protein
MKISIISFALLLTLNSWGQTPSQIQTWVLESIAEMPTQGGYQLTALPAQKMRDAFSWHVPELTLNAQTAVPSYCTTATYMIFYKVLQKYWTQVGPLPSHEVLSLLKPNLEPDGLRIWGRWNSNGPGSAKFFHDTDLGTNFDDLTRARPGDFLKIFWNKEVGKNERGHTVIFLGTSIQNGVEMIRFWSSNNATNGFGERIIPRSDVSRFLFSRLDNLDGILEIVKLEENDNFLASMLTRVSSWNEVRSVSGIQ